MESLSRESKAEKKTRKKREREDNLVMQKVRNTIEIDSKEKRIQLGLCFS